MTHPKMNSEYEPRDLVRTLKLGCHAHVRAGHASQEKANQSILSMNLAPI